MKHIKSVKELRCLIAQRCSPVTPCPGIYRWWFKQEQAYELLTCFTDLDKDRLQSREIDGETYLALYFGISKDMKQRAKWHISQHHTPSAVRSGFLSTLRQTLSALLREDMSTSEATVNNFMDANCYWEWDYTTTEQEAKEKEKAELTQSKYCYPLNIQENKTVPEQWLKRLTEQRKAYKK